MAKNYVVIDGCKFLNKWHMSLGVEDFKRNLRYTTEINVDAETFDEAMKKASEYAERMTIEGRIKYTAKNGYRIQFGGGCKW